MIDKNLIQQAAEEIDIFQADLTDEYDRLAAPRQHSLHLWPLVAAACVTGVVAIFLAPPRGKEEVEFSPPIESAMRNDWQYGEEHSMLEAQLIYQQEIKEKGKRLAAYIQEQQKTIEERY